MSLLSLFTLLREALGWLALVAAGTLAGTWIGVKMFVSPRRVNPDAPRSGPRCEKNPHPFFQKQQPTPQDFEMLVSFLQRAFTPEEVRTLVHRTGGDDAVAQLSGRCANEQTESAVAVLSRMGEVDGEFFKYILEKRPRRSVEIEFLRNRWIEAELVCQVQMER